MTDQELDDLLVRCGGKVKLALIVAEKGLSIEESRLRLEMAQGVLAKILAHEEEKEASKHQVNGFKHHRPVLCVDGGGSKCAAVVGFPGGKTVKAVAGPCNLTDGNFETSMESIITAAREAINDSAMTMNETNGINDDTVSLSRFDAEHQYSFGSIWIASAGMDRPGMRERVQKTLTQKLNLDKSVNMRITNDIDLLAAAMTRHPETSSSLVIVAGTGSIAIRYNLGGNENMPRRVARAGGWGHLLGDEGAGYAIGRQAIRKTLSSLENLTLSHRKSSLSPLETKILNFFSSSSFNTESDIEKVDLLSNVLMGSDDRTVKSRIASVAQMILNSGGRGDAEAVDIIARQVSDFIDNTLSRLLDPKSHGYVDPSKCGLILSGGVMLHSVYQTIFQLALAKHGIRFCYTEAVSNAAQVGAEFLNQSDARSKIFNGPSS